MVRFEGCCVYPHGGWTSALLWLASCAGLAATGYGVASCRMFHVAFEATDSGCFAETFGVDGMPASTSTQCTVEMGLYQWTKPNLGQEDGTSGSHCAGYTESMLEELSSAMFETARGFGVMSVLAALVLVLWSMLLCGVRLNRCQIWLFRLLSVMAAVSSGLTFVVQFSPICGDLLNAECSLDQGGLAMIAAVILWTAVVILAFVFLRANTMGGDEFKTAALGRRKVDPEDMAKFKGPNVASNPNYSAKKSKNAPKTQTVHESRRVAAGGPPPEIDVRRSSPYLYDDEEQRRSRQMRRQHQQKEHPAKSGRHSSSRRAKDRRGLRDANRPASPDAAPASERARKPRRKERLTVDDVTSRDQLEVFISRRREVEANMVK